MEKYLKIKQDSKVYKTLMEYENNLATWRKAVKQFTEENNIESKVFYVSKALGICDMTESDLAKFGTQLKKDGEWFKKSSKLYKRFEQLLEENGLTEDSRLRLIIWDYNIHDVYGRHSVQKLELEDNRYIKVISEYEFKTPEDFEEIKGSEWYKMIESLDEDEKNGCE